MEFKTKKSLGQNFLINDLIVSNIKNSVEASFTYFIKDNRKSGGKYVTVTDKFKKIDLYNKKIITYKKKEIPIEEIIDISDIKFKIS